MQDQTTLKLGNMATLTLISRDAEDNEIVTHHPVKLVSSKAWQGEVESWSACVTTTMTLTVTPDEVEFLADDDSGWTLTPGGWRKQGDEAQRIVLDGALTPDSLALFLDLAKDAGNWSGTPLIDITPAMRDNLTDLKKKGLLTTIIDGDCAFADFTLKGANLAAKHGIDLSWVEGLEDADKPEPDDDPDPVRIVLSPEPEPEPFVLRPELDPPAGRSVGSYLPGERSDLELSQAYDQAIDRADARRIAALDAPTIDPSEAILAAFRSSLKFGSIRTVADRGDWADLHGIVGADAPMVNDLNADWVNEVGSLPVAQAIAANSGWGLHDSPDTTFGDGSTRGWSPVIIGSLVEDREHQPVIDEEGTSTQHLEDLAAEHGMAFALVLHDFASHLRQPEFQHQQHAQVWWPDGSIDTVEGWPVGPYFAGVRCSQCGTPVYDDYVHTGHPQTVNNLICSACAYPDPQNGSTPEPEDALAEYERRYEDGETETEDLLNYADAAIDQLKSEVAQLRAEQLPAQPAPVTPTEEENMTELVWKRTAPGTYEAPGWAIMKEQQPGESAIWMVYTVIEGVPVYATFADTLKTAKRLADKAENPERPEYVAEQSWQERHFEIDQTGTTPEWDGQPCALCRIAMHEGDERGVQEYDKGHAHASCVVDELEVPCDHACDVCVEAKLNYDELVGELAQAGVLDQQLPLPAYIADLKEKLLRTQSALETERRAVEAWQKMHADERELVAELRQREKHALERLHEAREHDAPVHAGSLIGDAELLRRPHFANRLRLQLSDTPWLCELQHDLEKVGAELVAAYRTHEAGRGYRLTYTVLVKRTTPVFPEAPYATWDWSLGTGFGLGHYDMALDTALEDFEKRIAPYRGV